MADQASLQRTLGKLEATVDAIKVGVDDLKRNQDKLIDKELKFRDEVSAKHREMEKEIVQIKTWQKIKDSIIAVILGFIIFFKDIVKAWLFGGGGA